VGFSCCLGIVGELQQRIENNGQLQLDSSHSVGMTMGWVVMLIPVTVISTIGDLPAEAGIQLLRGSGLPVSNASANGQLDSSLSVGMTKGSGS
jgi:hypothetical protein